MSTAHDDLFQPVDISAAAVQLYVGGDAGENGNGDDVSSISTDNQRRSSSEGPDEYGGRLTAYINII